jgi:hypothetical protein
MGSSHKNRGRKSRATVPLKFFEEQKTPGGKKYIISSYSAAKNMSEMAEVKLSCGHEVADFRKNCDCGIAKMRLRSNIPLKVAELRLRKFFLQVAELRLRTPKNCACPPLALGY